MTTTVSKQAVDKALLVMEEREEAGRALSVSELMRLHSIAEDRLREEIAAVEAEKRQLIADWDADSDRAAEREAKLCRRLNWLHMILFGAGLFIAYLVAR